MFRGTGTYDPTASPFPPAIKWLLIANGGVFVLQILLAAPLMQSFGVRFEDVFGLRPAWVIERGWVWQPLTYMFLHGGFFHLLFNMFVLWMFGSEIERFWGREGFLKYYLVCGLGAAAASFVFNYHSVVIGASGAVLGVLLAFGLLFPNQYIYLWFLLPIRAKYLVAGIAALEVLFLVSQPGGGIARAAHLGGMLAGFIYLRWRRGDSPVSRLANRWRRRHLKLIEGGRGRGRSRRTGLENEAEIDRILDKISKHGLESLTPEEERILDEASRRGRER
ncbi:MAG TPA: rhomboid family intramembrane serine protease [Gemmatimonadota bacterium]|nr:rhomboid family intramembrane serine protease [Gemmatimonadota bacterium]